MSIREIVAVVSAKHGCSPAQLCRSYPNAGRFAKPRSEAMATIRREFGWSYPRIGKYFGYHHTSVMSAVKTFNATNNASGHGLEFARPVPTARYNRKEIDELRVRVEHLEEIVREAGLFFQRKPPISEVA